MKLLNPRKVIVLLLFAAFITICVYGARRYGIDRNTITSFEPASYMGRWYEIARFDHSFERGLSHVTADYTLMPDGMIDVLNSGLRDGKPSTAHGRAKTTKHTGRLRVSFFMFFYSDYNIMEMGDDGDWVLVGSRSPKYLWILARKPSLPQTTIDYIVSLAERRGYDVDNLIFVEQ